MLEYDVVARRIDAYGSSARCKDAEIVLDTDVNAGRLARYRTRLLRRPNSKAKSFVPQSPEI